jgi:hypothetical protein
MVLARYMLVAWLAAAGGYVLGASWSGPDVVVAAEARAESGSSAPSRGVPMAAKPDAAVVASCDEEVQAAVSASATRADQLCDLRIRSAGCAESLPWPEGQSPEADRAAWDAALAEMEARCPGLRDDLLWVDCAEYPCTLIAARSLGALRACGLDELAPRPAGEEVAHMRMESSIGDTPFTYHASVGAEHAAEAGARRDIRFREAWSIAEEMLSD